MGGLEPSYLLPPPLRCPPIRFAQPDEQGHRLRLLEEGSVAISRNQSQSVAISRNQSHSVALSRTQSHSVGTQSHSVALSRNQSHSVALRGTRLLEEGLVERVAREELKQPHHALDDASHCGVVREPHEDL